MAHRYPHRLILVEGLTGSGKSTTAHFIARQLQANRIPARWIHEGELAHPVLIDVDTTIEQYMADIRERWTAFVQQTAQSREVVVVEASFFNNLIETVFAHAMDRAEVIRYGLELLAMIDILRPALLYLDPGDLEAALARNFQNRGEGFRDYVIAYCTGTLFAKKHALTGYAGMVAFWHAFVSITAELFERWPYAKCAVSIAATEWESHYQQMLDFLSIPYVAERNLPPQTITRLTGTYADMSQDQMFEVSVQDDRLMIDIRGVPTRLVPLNEDVYAVAGWHFTAQFTTDDSGQITQLIINGADVDYFALAGTRASRVS